MNRGSIVDLPCGEHYFTKKAKFLGSDGIFQLAYAGLAASQTLLQQLLACLNLTLDSEDLLCWYKQRKWFLWTMASAQAPKNHGDE